MYPQAKYPVSVYQWGLQGKCRKWKGRSTVPHLRKSQYNNSAPPFPPRHPYSQCYDLNGAELGVAVLAFFRSRRVVIPVFRAPTVPWPYRFHVCRPHCFWFRRSKRFPAPVFVRAIERCGQKQIPCSGRRLFF